MSPARLLAAFALAALLLVSGCSSDTSNQQPKLEGTNHPEVKRAGRSAGGDPAKGGAPSSQAPVSKP
jgi:hypothetical protein